MKFGTVIRWREPLSHDSVLLMSLGVDGVNPNDPDKGSFSVWAVLHDPRYPGDSWAWPTGALVYGEDDKNTEIVEHVR